MFHEYVYLLKKSFNKSHLSFLKFFSIVFYITKDEGYKIPTLLFTGNILSPQYYYQKLIITAKI